MKGKGKAVRVSNKPLRAFGGPSKQPKVNRAQFGSGFADTKRKVTSSLGDRLGKK